MATYAEQIKTLKKKIANFDTTGGGKTSQKAKTLEQWKKELKRLQSLPETNKEQLSTLRGELKRLEEGGAYKPTRTANWMPGSGAHTNRVKTLKNTISDLGGDLEDESKPVVSIDNKEVEVPADPTILSSSIRGQQKANLADQADSRSQGNPWMPQASYNVAMQGGNTVFIGNDTDRINAAEFQKFKNAADQRTKLSETGGREYVTDYQTAIQNSRRDGLSFGEAEQYYGEDVLDSAGQRVRKSNEFTEDEDGNPMGVKTRKQRLALDLARAEAAIPQPDKTEVKTDQDDLTTTKTGTVSNDAGTPKGVVEPVIKSPLSDLFDDRVG